MSIDVTVQVFSTSQEADLQEALASLHAAGLTTEAVVHQPGPQAALEWIMATALIVWVGDKYFGAFLEEAGKDHYHALKRFLSNAFDRTLGPHATVTRTIRTMSGTEKPDKLFSGNLSYIYKSSEGWTAKLIFPLDVTASQHEVACQNFAQLVTDYRHSPEASTLGAEVARGASEKGDGLPAHMQTPDLRTRVRLLIYWNSAEGTFYTPDPIKSARHGKLVARRLGTEA